MTNSGSLDGVTIQDDSPIATTIVLEKSPDAVFLFIIQYIYHVHRKLYVCTFLDIDVIYVSFENVLGEIKKQQLEISVV